MSLFKISFDFDETLSYESVQDFVRFCQKNYDVEVWIVTGRINDKYNTDLYEIADQLNIPHDHIIFMNHANKSEFFKSSDFLFHVDDDFIELEFIQEETDVIGIDVRCDVEWKEKCLTLLNEAR